MRNFQLEAAIWYLFTSTDFYEAAASESESIMTWFRNKATSSGTTGFGRNSQIHDLFKRRATDFRRGAELARLGDYDLIHDIGGSIRGDARGMLEQPLRTWMTGAEYDDFFRNRVDRLLAYAMKIERALANAMVKGDDSYFDPKPECPGRNHDDDGFPGGSIVYAYETFINWDRGGPISVRLPDPLPEYTVDKSIACRTGEEVPWTGVWYPSTGLDNQGLTFAIKGLRMQPAFRIVKTAEEMKAEGQWPSPQTMALVTTWHPVIPLVRKDEPERELRTQGGDPCPRAGIWQQVDAGAAQRRYAAGETMANLGSAYGFTVWRWISD